MNTYKQKLVDSLEGENLFYFKYLLWGNWKLITSKQFIHRCLLLDLIIMAIAFFDNIFMISCFKDTKVNGFTDFIILVLVFTTLSLLSCLAINF